MPCAGCDCDAAKDLELMLAPLGRLPQVEVLTPVEAPCRWAEPQPVELQICLELNRAEPLVDFARQMLEMLFQLATSQGVIFSPAVVRFAQRFIRHAEAVTAAGVEVDSRRSKYPRRE